MVPWLPVDTRGVVQLHGAVLVQAPAHGSEQRHGVVPDPAELVALDASVAVVVGQLHTVAIAPREVVAVQHEPLCAFEKDGTGPLDDPVTRRRKVMDVGL